MIPFPWNPRNLQNPMTEKPSLWWIPATEIHMNCQFYPKKNRNNNNSNNNNNYYYYYHYYDCYYISYPPFPWNPLYPAQKQSFFFDTFIKILISVKSNRIQLWCSSMSIITLFRWKDFPDLADLVDFFLYFTQCVLATGEWCMCLFWFSPQILNERYKQYHEVRSPWVNPCLLI